MSARPFIEMFHPALFLIALAQQPTTPPQDPKQSPKPPAQTSPATTPAQPTATGPTPVTPPPSSANPVQPTTATTPPAMTPPVPAVMAFVKAMTVSELSRLALTPKIDGKIEEEEWDAFSMVDTTETYFQWEPNKLHFAATHVPNGQDLVVSIDGHGDGWLVGRDNLEVRIHWNNNVAEVTERLLDNTPVSGPMWADASSFRAATTVATSSDEKGHTVELTVSDPATGLVPDHANTTVGIRLDLIPEPTLPADPLLPRVMVPTHLLLARGNGLPAGLTWSPEIPERTVVPGEKSKIRLTFKGNDDLGIKRVDMRTEGLGQNDTESSGVPFPSFDKKGRAFVDYKTGVTSDAALGYRVMKATVHSQGQPAVLEASYEITPIVSFDFHERLVPASSEPQIAKFSAYIKSNTSRRVDGVFRIEAPEGWKVKSGNDKPFLIYNSRGSKRQVFEVMIPGGFKGTAAIKLIADFAGKHSEQTEYIVVQ